MDKTTALVVMAKQPRIGTTKTRLCPPFSLQKAAELYEALLRDTLVLAGSLPEVHLAVAITPSTASSYFEKISPVGTLLLPVEGADIGECLAQATGDLFSAGFKRVIALNADGPSLPRDYLLQAISLLGDNGVVLGPGEDGGYYLIGLNSPCPGLFQQISWSTSHVLNQTLARAEAFGLPAALTATWYDVDTAQDAARLAAELVHLSQAQLIYSRRFFNTYPPAKWQAA